MSDTEARYEVLEEFTQGLLIWERPGERQYRMADEIVRLRQRLDRAERILAALREPRFAVVDAVYDIDPRIGWTTNTNIIRAAVAAAEKGVDA